MRFSLIQSMPARRVEIWAIKTTLSILKYPVIPALFSGPPALIKRHTSLIHFKEGVIAMQINRTNNLLYLPAGSQQTTSKPATTESPQVTSVPVEVSPAPAAAIPTTTATVNSNPELGGTYSSAGYVEKKFTPPELTSLNDMSLSSQLEVGKSMGVFTKITLSKEGVLVAKPDLTRAVNSPEFVASAVTTIKDFQEGIAVLKENSTHSNSKASDLLSGSLRNLQNVAARFHVFA